MPALSAPTTARSSAASFNVRLDTVVNVAAGLDLTIAALCEKANIMTRPPGPASKVLIRRRKGPQRLFCGPFAVPSAGNSREQPTTGPSVFADFPACSLLCSDNERIGETGVEACEHKRHVRAWAVSWAVGDLLGLFPRGRHGGGANSSPAPIAALDARDDESCIDGLQQKLNEPVALNPRNVDQLLKLELSS
jgi:hypothetical protein